VSLFFKRAMGAEGVNGQPEAIEMSILLAHTSKHDAIGENAKRIAQGLRATGQHADTRAVQDAGDLADYEGFVIGSTADSRHWLKDATASVGATGSSWRNARCDVLEWSTWHRRHRRHGIDGHGPSSQRGFEVLGRTSIRGTTASFLSASIP
jgi:hypothetical protein